MLKKTLFISFITLLLLSCGGGGGSDGDRPRLISAAAGKIQLISGIFKTVRPGPPEDKAFLHIAKDGKVTVYDDQMDAKDSGSNCYKLATLSTQINSTLHNGIITYDTSTNRYTITKGTNTVSFTYTDADGMKDFSLNGSVSTGATLNNTSSVNVYLGAPNNKKDTSITKSTLDSSICP